MDTHFTTQSALTCLLKEFDMTKTGKGAKISDVESQDVFGISDSRSDESLQIGSSSRQHYRIVLKTTI
jgi:NDP-sugar pyrophosphorylase family protein